MHETEEFLDRAAEALRRQAVDVVQLLRPGHPVLPDVPRPASQIGEPLRLLQVDIGVGERGRALAHALIELVCARRRFSSLRRRTATSAASTRLGTDRLIMKVSSSRKDSLMPRWANGPHLLDRGPDGKAGQYHGDACGIARAPPQRRPDQRQDSEEAERRGVFRARQQRAEGDEADRHGSRRARAMPIGSSRVEAAPVGLGPQHDRRRHHQRAGESPSHQVTQMALKFAPGGKAGERSASPPRSWR